MSSLACPSTPVSSPLWRALPREVLLRTGKLAEAETDGNEGFPTTEGKRVAPHPDAVLKNHEPGCM